MMDEIVRLSRRGFTLIELLVVIAIIGILASVVLASLQDARQSAKDSNIKQTLASMRSQAELYRVQHGTYASPSFRDDDLNSCKTKGTNIFNTGDFNALVDGAYEQAGGGGRVFCAADATTWAFAIRLNNPPSGATGWCVDSSGAAQEVSFNMSLNPDGSAANHPLTTNAGVARCP